MPSLIGEDVAQETIDYTDGIYLEFGADPHVEGVGNTEEVKRIRARAIQAGLKLVDCPIRHLGTEKAQEIYYAIEQYLLEHGVETAVWLRMPGFDPEGWRLRGRAGGRGGRNGDLRRSIPSWPRAAAARTGWRASAPSTTSRTSRARWISACAWSAGTRSWSSVNEVLYESKLIGYPKPFKNKVRTFCQNPGRVRQPGELLTIIWPSSTAIPTRI